MLTNTQKEVLKDKVYELLGTVGMRLEHEKMEKDLIALGCTKSPAGRIRFPKDVLDKLVASQKKSQAWDDVRDKFLCNFGIIDWGNFIWWTDSVDKELEKIKKGVRTSVFDCGPTVFYDYPTGKKLPVDTKIFTDMKKWAHTVPEIGYIANWYRQDIPQEIERIDSLVNALKITDKCGGVEGMIPEHIKYLVECGEIMTGKPNESAYIAGSQCVTPPLIFDHRSAEEAVERAKRGVNKYHVATMMTVGLNTPVTPASSMIMFAAEILGGMVCVWSQNQDADITGRMLTSVSDMRNAQVTYATAEATMINIGVKELFDEFFGGHIRVDTFFITTAKKPGLQAVTETFCGGSRYGNLRGMSNIKYPGVGTLDNGGCGSPTQAVLDLEIRKAQFIPESISFDGDAIPFAEMCERVEGEKDFFTSDHTLEHFRELRTSPIFRTDEPHAGQWAADEKTILDKCDEIWREQLKTYTPPALSEDKVKALDDVLARAKKEFLG